MRWFLILALMLPTPALAQFPPPGIYECFDSGEVKLGTLSLLVAGDYQWDAGGKSFVGQIASSGSDVEALSGVLGDTHWRGSFGTDADGTTFVFETDGGTVTCRPPPP